MARWQLFKFSDIQNNIFYVYGADGNDLIDADWITFFSDTIFNLREEKSPVKCYCVFVLLSRTE
jgi:hypothetical protein